MTPIRPSRSRGPTTVAHGRWLVVAAVLFAIQALAPGDWAYVGVLGASALALAAITIGVRRHRPARRWVWVVLGGAQICTLAGGASVAVIAPWLDTTPALYLIPSLWWLASPVLVVGAGLGMVSAHDIARCRTTAVDAALLAVAGLFPIVVLAGDLAGSDGSAGLFSVVAVLYPLADLAALLTAALVLCVARPRHRALWLLTASLACSTATDLVGAMVVGVGPEDDISALSLGWLVGYVLIGLCALDPSMVRLTGPERVDRDSMDITRGLVFLAALVSVPVTNVLELVATGDVHVVVSASFAAVLAGLALLRVRWLFAERDRAQQAVERREQYFRALVQNVADLIFVVDAEGCIESHTDGAERALGYTTEELAGADVMGFIHPDDLELAGALLAEALSRPGGTVQGELRCLHRDGSVRWMSVTAVNRLDDPDVQAIVAACHDVTQRVALEEELRRQAFHDTLTGLPNRALAIDRLAQAAARSRRGQRPTAVLYVDIDNFKVVNDSLGHAAGDELLTEVGRRLRSAVRDEDTVARLGGDEFLVVVESVDAVGPEELAQRLVQRFGTSVVVAGRPVLVSISVGVASSVTVRGDVSGAELLRCADIALYRAKAEGRNTHAVYSEAMATTAAAQLELAADLQEALTDLDGNFFLLFQPIMRLGDGDIGSVEALVRWRHPRRGVVPPDRFIPLAETNGMIDAIGRWVLRDACAQVAALERDEGRVLAVTVNVSARQLAEDLIVAAVAEALQASGLPAHRLTLELTETALMHDVGASARRLAELKALGVGIAVDDFGTGYSSLAYLREFPIDTVKIDRQFVGAIDTSDRDAALTRSVLELSRAVGFTTVAEGVERPSQRRVLTEWGCSFAQGFLIARPGPLAEVVARADAAPRSPHPAEADAVPRV